MFSIIDSDADANVTFGEFKSKLRQMDIKLDDEEILSFFKSLDVNGSGQITYDELIARFSALNNKQLLTRISKFVMSGNANPNFAFERYSSDHRRGHMTQDEFKKMVKEFFKKGVSNAEIQNMYRHFDRGAKGYITRDEFTSAFTTEPQEQVFKI